MRTLEGTKNRIFTQLFFLSSFIFVTFVATLTPIVQISVGAEIFSVIGVAAFLIYSALYMLNPKKGKIPDYRRYLLLGAFCIQLLSLVGILFFVVEVHGSIIAALGSGYSYMAAYVVLFLPLVFLIFLGTYLLKEGHRKLGIVLLLAALAVLGFYAFSGLVFHHYKIDDEVFILFAATKAFFAGSNPYSISVSQQLFHNITSGYANQPSITSDSRIVGTFNYPSLYLLTFIPFYFLSQPTPANLVNIDLAAQEMLFIFIALFAVALVIEKEALKKPSYALIFFVIIALSYISSIATYLMFALLVLAYAKLESRYSWVFLGLCASLQEQLWVPVLLLIIYSFRNEGGKKGVSNLAGTAGVFLLLNGFFILLGPSSFVANLLSPVDGSLLPNVASYIGYLLVDIYPILLNSYSLIFGLGVLVCALLFFGLNEKRLVGLFSMIPFLLNSHSGAVYYTFFTGFMVVTFFISEKKKGVPQFELGKNAVYLAALIVMLLIVAIVYFSHIAYQSEFNLQSGNESLYFNSTLNKTIYSATLHYPNISNQTVYVLALTISKYQGGYEGMLNSSILNQSSCVGIGYACTANNNVLILPKNSSGYKVVTYLERGLYSEPIYGARLVVYNKNHFYISQGAFNQSVLNSLSTP